MRRKVRTTTTRLDIDQDETSAYVCVSLLVDVADVVVFSGVDGLANQVAGDLGGAERVLLLMPKRRCKKSYGSLQSAKKSNPAVYVTFQSPAGRQVDVRTTCESNCQALDRDRFIQGVRTRTCLVRSLVSGVRLLLQVRHLFSLKGRQKRRLTSEQDQSESRDSASLDRKRRLAEEEETTSDFIRWMERGTKRDDKMLRYP